MTEKLSDRIKREVSCRQVLAVNGKLSSGPETGNVICPFHEDNASKPSLSVTPNDSGHRFKCFGCSETGSVIDLQMKLAGMDFAAAVNYLGKHFGLRSDAPAPRQKAKEGDGELVGSTLYDYRDPSGKVIMRKIRWDRKKGDGREKSFTQWRPLTQAEQESRSITLRPDGKKYHGKCEIKTYRQHGKVIAPDCANTLEGYSFAYSFQADKWHGKAAAVIKTEGEKDACAVTLGTHVGTCSNCGANKSWEKAHIAALIAGGVTHVTHFADHDVPGLECLLRDAREFAAAGIKSQSLVSLIGQVDHRDGSLIAWQKNHGADIHDVLPRGTEAQRLAKLEELLANATTWDAGLELALSTELKALKARFKEAASAEPASATPAPTSSPAQVESVAKPARSQMRSAPSDSGNAERLLRLCGRDIRWVICDSSGRCEWALYEENKFGGSRWHFPVADEVILGLTRQVYEELEEEAEELSLEAVMEAHPQLSLQQAAAYLRDAKKFALNCQSGARRREMVNLLKAEPSLRVEFNAFDANPMILNAANGVINLRTKELRPPTREDFCIHFSPIIYDPDAKCPLFNKVLAYSQGDCPLRIAALIRWFGYCATGKVGEEKMMVWWGSNGRNGKSKLIEALSFALGSYAGMAPPDFLNHDKQSGVPTDMADLKGLRCCVISEPEEGQRLALSKVKSLTGGDTVVARKMHKDFFRFAPTHKITMLVNERPQVRGDTDAIWQRLYLVPFDRTVPESERDMDLDIKLQAEAPGILALAVRGAAEWAAGTLDLAVFRQFTAAWKSDEDLLGDFLHEFVAEDPTQSARKDELYKLYKKWATDKDVSPWAPTVFGRVLTQRGYREIRHGKLRVRLWKGIRIKTQSEIDAATADDVAGNILPPVSHHDPPVSFAATLSRHQAAAPTGYRGEFPEHETF